LKNDITDKSRNMIFIVLIISSIIGAMLQTSLTTALPIIMQDFNISAATGQWLTSAYALAMGIMIPVTPFLLKRFLTKPLFLAGMGMYFIGLLFSSIAPSFSILLLGRVVQALGNGILLSMTQVVILTIFSPDKRGTAMGIYGLAIGAAPVLAPTITGMVIDIIDWHIIFWFALVLVAIDILLACVFMKNVLKNEKPSFDFLSLFYSALGYCGLIIGIGNLGTYPFLSFLVSLPLLVGIAMLILFSLRQLHVAEPLLELRTLKNREFRLSVIMSMLLYGVMMGGSTLFPIYIQIVHGLSATMSGLIMMPGSLAMAIISPFAGKIYDKFGMRLLAVLGSIFMVSSCIAISFVGPSSSIIYITVMYIARLISISCIMMPIITWGMSTMDERYTAHGTALLSSLRTIAGAVGSAVFVAIMSFATKISSNSESITANAFGINAAFFGISVLSVIQLVVAFIFVKNRQIQKNN
jgi:EmrB/QacA subfamily drug resistance transporter